MNFLTWRKTYINYGSEHIYRSSCKAGTSCKTRFEAVWYKVAKKKAYYDYGYDRQPVYNIVHTPFVSFPILQTALICVRFRDSLLLQN